MISTEELASYERDGFLVVRNLFSTAEMRQASRWITELEALPLQRGGMMVYLEDDLEVPGRRILSRIEQFLEYHSALRSFLEDCRLVSRVERLLGEPGILFKEKINCKLPGGDGFKPHQDIQPGWDEYCNYFLSVLITIDESTLENGCLELAAGHHRRGWIGRRHTPLEGHELEGIQFEPFPMSPGDVAFFDCFVPHQSKPNRTTQARRNLYLTYNRASAGDHRERYYADKRRNFPPDFEREPGKVYRFKV